MTIPFYPPSFAARREALCLSQEDMAAIYGVKQNTISQWENGTRSPRDPQQVMGILSAFESEFLYLVDRYFNAGRQAIELPDFALFPTQADYVQEAPELAAQGIPWKLHRAAVAHAHMKLRAEGYGTIRDTY